MCIFKLLCQTTPLTINDAGGISIEAKGILGFKVWFLSSQERISLAELAREDALEASFDSRKIIFDQKYADNQRLLESEFVTSNLAVTP